MVWCVSMRGFMLKTTLRGGLIFNGWHPCPWVNTSKKIFDFYSIEFLNPKATPSTSASTTRICWEFIFLKELSFVTHSDFLILILSQPDGEDFRYFNLWILLAHLIQVWNIKCLQHQVAKILELENLSLWQKFNSFTN